MRWSLDFTSPSGVRKNDTLHFALIAPAVQGTFDQAAKAEHYRSVSAKLVRMPDGTERRFPEGTLMFWEWKYRHGGFEALVRGSRADAGESRAITPAQTTVDIAPLCSQYPQRGCGRAWSAALVCS